MFRKTLSTTLAALLLFSLAACGDEPVVNSPSADSTTTVTQSVTQGANDAAQIIFEETVFVDNESCTFKITEIEDDSMWGYTLKAYLENKTDKELMFSLSNVSVNGFMCDPFWAESVTSGMKANAEISFSGSDLEKNRIDAVTDIEFTLNVYDNNDWNAEYLVSETFSIYPMGEEAVEPFVRNAQEGEIVLFDNENCAMIITGFDPENIWGYSVSVYLENKTDKELMFSVTDAAVNGFMCDPLWAETVAPGKRSITEISWLENDFAANGITDVESLSLPVSVYDSNDWTAAYLVEETFTVNP